MSKEILYDDEALNTLKRGVDALANAVKVTLGPRGRNVIIGRLKGNPHVTKDGVSVAKEVDLKNANDNLGVRLLRQAASKTADDAGDGTTTATVLAQALVHGGLKQVSAGRNPADLKRGIDRAVRAVVRALADMSRPVGADAGEIGQVATISANGDDAIGKLLADAMRHVGRNGVIDVEESKTPDTSIELVSGMRYARGWLSPYLVTDPARMRAVYEDCLVLVHDRKVSMVKDLLPLLEKIVESGRPALLVVEDMDGDALHTVLRNRVERGLPVVVVKAPGFGQRRDMDLQDICVITGATLVSEKLMGMRLENTTIEMLGRVQKVVVEKEQFTLIGGGGKPEARTARIQEVRDLMATVTDDYDKEMLADRLGRLDGGVALLKVGAPTEVEMREKRDRVDDALHATRAAVEEGILPGGGTAYLRARTALKDTMSDPAFPEDERIGVRLVHEALAAPLRTIAANAGQNAESIVAAVDRSSGNAGWNARTMDFVDDLVADGVIDPAKVARVALENAASVAGTLLLNAVVLNEVPDDDALAPPARGGR